MKGNAYNNCIEYNKQNTMQIKRCIEFKVQNKMHDSKNSLHCIEYGAQNTMEIIQCKTTINKIQCRIYTTMDTMQRIQFIVYNAQKTMYKNEYMESFNTMQII